MPNIEIKTIDRLSLEDRLVVDFGNLHKSGRSVETKLIQMLGRGQVPHVPTISLTYEEKKRLPTEESRRAYIDDILQKRNTPWEELRYELFQHLQEVYHSLENVSESSQALRRLRALHDDSLLETRISQDLQSEIRHAAEYLFSDARIAKLSRTFQSMLEWWKGFSPNMPDLESRRIFPRVSALSIRMQPIYENEKIVRPGTAIAWHAADTAYLYLAALYHLNRTREVMGCPPTGLKYNVHFSYGDGMVYRYPEEYLVNAAIGAAYHALGFCHPTVQNSLRRRPLIQASGEFTQKIEGAINMVRHLVKSLDNLSPMTRIVILGQSEYPDGSGWPQTKRNHVPHEFVRLFHVVELYDSLTNPWYQKTVYSREDVLALLWNNSEYYPEGVVPYPTATPFDRGMVEQFLSVLGPWQLGEKVYLFPYADLSTPHFVGRVYQYLKSYVPLISILRDERTGQTYPFGRFLLDIPNGQSFMIEDKQVRERRSADWITQLRIHDTTVNPGDIGKLYHPLLHRAHEHTNIEEEPTF